MKKRLLWFLPVMPVLYALIWRPFFRWVGGAYPFLWAAVFLPPLCFPLSHLLPKGGLSRGLHLFGEGVMMPLVTLLSVVAVGDVLCLFRHEWGGWAVLAVYAVMLCVGIINAFHIRTREYKIKLGLTEPLRLVLISDLHLGFFSDRKMMKRIADAVIGAKPDLTVVAGDIFDDAYSDVRHPAAVQEGFRRMAAAAPVYAAEGNHDLRDASEKRDGFLKDAGIHLLRDEKMRFHDVTFVFRRDQFADVRLDAEVILADCPHPLVAVDHAPSETERLWDAGADLVLSGHTHGGQSFPGTLLRGILRHFYGLYEKDGHCSVVTGGAGFYGFPLRLMANNEVVILEMK